MALSGNAITNDYSGRYYEFKWSATQDIANNKSKITWELYALGGSSAWYAERTLKLVVNGSTLYSKTDRVERYAGKITSGNFSITHTASGECSMTVDLKAAVYVTDVNLTRTKTFTLDKIPRAATLTGAPDFHDANAPVISYSNPAGNSVTSLQACISLTGATDDVPYRDIPKTGTSYTFYLTTEEMNTLRNATSGNSRTVKFFVKTVIGGNTYYSQLTKTFSIYNTSISFSPTGYDTNSRTVALTGNSSYIVQGYSNFYYNAGASAASGSISSIKATCGGITKSSATGTFSGATSSSITFTATDSRGNTGTGYLNNYLIGYFKPTLTLDISPTTAAGEMTISVSGTFYNGSFGKVMNSLTCRYSITHEGSGYSQGSSFDLYISGNNYSGSVTLTGLNYKQAYEVTVNAYDALDEADLNPVKAIGKPMFDWGSGDFNVNVPIKLNEQTVLEIEEIDDKDNLIIGGQGGAIRMRPNGADDSTTEALFNPDGSMSTTGNIYSAKNVTAEGYLWSKGNAYVYGALSVTGDAKSYIDGGLIVNNTMELGAQKLLHTDSGRYFHDTQSLDLTGNNRIVNQLTGYILVWQYYASNTVYTENINYTFIPKYAATINGGKITLPLGMDDGSSGSKTLFVTDNGTKTTIKGHTKNDEAPNNKWVLKYIIGY